MTRDEAVALARRWMEGGESEHAVREHLRRAGYAGRAADGIVQEAYRSRLKLTGSRSSRFERKQLMVFCLGVAVVCAAPLTGAPWSMFGGFNLNMFIVGTVGIFMMIGAVAMRPQVK